MCAEAILQSRIAKVIFGAYDPRSGALGSVFNLLLRRQNVPDPRGHWRYHGEPVPDRSERLFPTNSIAQTTGPKMRSHQTTERSPKPKITTAFSTAFSRCCYSDRRITRGFIHFHDTRFSVSDTAVTHTRRGLAYQSLTRLEWPAGDSQNNSRRYRRRPKSLESQKTMPCG